MFWEVFLFLLLKAKMCDIWSLGTISGISYIVSDSKEWGRKKVGLEIFYITDLIKQKRNLTAPHMTKLISTWPTSGTREPSHMSTKPEQPPQQNTHTEICLCFFVFLCHVYHVPQSRSTPLSITAKSRQPLSISSTCTLQATNVFQSEPKPPPQASSHQQIDTLTLQLPHCSYLYL